MTNEREKKGFGIEDTWPCWPFYICHPYNYNVQCAIIHRQNSCMGLLLETFSRNGSVSIVIPAWCSFLRREHANRSSYWCVPSRRDTWQWCRQLQWRFAGLGLASLTSELRVGDCCPQTTCSSVAGGRDSFFAVESASATGDLRCSWE